MKAHHEELSVKKLAPQTFSMAGLIPLCSKTGDRENTRLPVLCYDSVFRVCGRVLDRRGTATLASGKVLGCSAETSFHSRIVFTENLDLLQARLPGQLGESEALGNSDETESWST
jgi:hypothetical protein